MPSISAVVLSYQKKKDGTYNVKYRITKNSKSSYFASSHYVIERQLTDKFQIKDKSVLFQLDTKILEYRKKLMGIESKLPFLSAVDISKFLQEEANNDSQIEFLSFMDKECKDLLSDKKKSYDNYRPAYNHLFKFAKGSLVFTSITPNFLSLFEKYLLKEKVGVTGISKYMSCIRASFNRGKDIYNDEDLGIIRIPNNPFSKYKVPSEVRAEIKDAGLEVVMALLNYIPTNKLEELSKDMFFLSFYLIGINAVDIYNDDTKISNGRLIYQRSKTKERRSDGSEISVRIEDEVVELLDKYKGEGDKIFNLSSRFSSSKNFNHSLSRGFIQIRKNLGFKNLTFYSARHSWATIASHNCNIMDSHIARCLNHVSVDFKTTNRYIKRDWSTLDNCNRQVLDFFASEIKKIDKI